MPAAEMAEHAAETLADGIWADVREKTKANARPLSREDNAGMLEETCYRSKRREYWEDKNESKRTIQNR